MGAGDLKQTHGFFCDESMMTPKMSHDGSVNNRCVHHSKQTLLVRAKFMKLRKEGRENIQPRGREGIFPFLRLHLTGETQSTPEDDCFFAGTRSAGGDSKNSCFTAETMGGGGGGSLLGGQLKATF